MHQWGERKKKHSCRSGYFYPAVNTKAALWIGNTLVEGTHYNGHHSVIPYVIHA